MRVVVTGAAGFVGTFLCRRLSDDGDEVIAVTRPGGAPAPAGAAVRTVAAALETDAGWAQVLAGADAVVHLAALVHRRTERVEEARYIALNADTSAALARRAAEAGVRRFVFASTVKVHGERSRRDAAGRAIPFSETDDPAPEDAYARSKWAAERALADLHAQGAIGVTVLRPPLVYGPGAGANFLALLRAVDRGLPLPFARVRNARSLLYVGNLVDAIACALRAERAGRTWLVSDGQDVSTPELVRRLAAALGRRARLIPVPPRLLRAGAAMLGRRAAIDRLLDSLTVDTARIRSELGWRPPYTLAEGLAETAAGYRRA